MGSGTSHELLRINNTETGTDKINTNYSYSELIQDIKLEGLEEICKKMMVKAMMPLQILKTLHGPLMKKGTVCC